MVSLFSFMSFQSFFLVFLVFVCFVCFHYVRILNVDSFVNIGTYIYKTCVVVWGITMYWNPISRRIPYACHYKQRFVYFFTRFLKNISLFSRKILSLCMASI